jgi:hypothetical protein
LRGCTADIIILEEAAHMDKQIFFQVVAPLLSVANTAILAISTPEGELNYYSQLMQLKNENDGPLFKCIQIGLSCAKCTAKGITVQCKHNKGRLPQWKNAKRQRKTETVMSSDPEMRARELLGNIVSGTNFIFSPYMDKFKKRVTDDPIQLNGQPGVVHMSIDPSGGGNPSDYAIVSYVYNKGTQVIVGIDACSSRRDAVKNQLIMDHVGGIRTRFPYALIVVYIESNFDCFAADGIRTMITHPMLGAVKVISDTSGKEERVGVYTGPGEKRRFAEQLEHYLRVDSLTMSDTITSSSDDTNEVRDKLIAQMETYRRDIRAPSDETHGTWKVSYSGKSSGCKDDLVLALQIVLYWSHVQLADDDFIEYCRNGGFSLTY